MPNKTIYAVAWSPDGRWRLAAAGNAIESTIGFTAGSREEYSCGTKTIVGVGGDATYSSLREAPPPTRYWPSNEDSLAPPRLGPTRRYGRVVNGGVRVQF